MNKYNLDQEVIVDGNKYFIINFRQIYGFYQYSLSKTKGGDFVFACGEGTIERAVEPELNNDTFGEKREFDIEIYMPQTVQNYEENAAYMNTTAMIMRKSILGTEGGVATPELVDLVGSSVFFKPSRQMVKWLINYADGRQIIEVGAGQGHLLRMINQNGGNAIGLEPNFNQKRFIQSGYERYGSSFNQNEMLPYTVEKAKNLINGFGNKALLVFARPCHSNFVETGIYNMPNEMEALYITKPENLKLYNDLGEFRDCATLLEHDGVSEDNEVVYSIKKQKNDN